MNYYLDILSIYGFKILYSVVTLVVGLKIIKYSIKLLDKSFEKMKLDKSLVSFSRSFIKMALKVILFVTVASMLGVATTTFVAILGAMSLAIGLALQGSLANFAGGVLILGLKPFKVGDYIESVGHSGTVEGIQIFHTYLTTPDNKQIIIPNGSLANASIINYSFNNKRRVDLVFGVGYESSTKKVKEIILSTVKKHDKVLETPMPFVRMSSHGESSIDFTLRVWCKSEDYWDIHFDLIEEVKEAFDKEGINIPYPHMDINLLK
ncbi:mechanosensitive ion channel family protein [Helicovermis profundi]|uniref:Mechanosensitive ion channel n=1 Tax=Helicovermis profundi TaxID=3065157 RepID=A0AAU9EZ52_9FIRM|nr:mechanosensitive ion channel [Clostridia bacterium S502]